MTKTETINVNQSELTLQQELQKEIQILEAENERMKKLSTRIGFFEQFFLNLPFYECAIACFNFINDEYHSLFGQYRYSDYESFKQAKYHISNGN